jgi:hypothetical protein
MEIWTKAGADSGMHIVEELLVEVSVGINQAVENKLLRIL